MPFSSLIFLVIIAVWAAYLIQHWIRRRDHVATARSVDRFSEAMRVLERRRSLPPVDLSTPQPRSYAVSPARPAHPDVVVKRAQPSQSPAPVRERAPRRRRLSPALVRGLQLLVGVLLLAAGVALTLIEILPWWGWIAGLAGFVLSVASVRASVARQRRRAASPVRPRAASPVRSRAASSRRPTTPARRVARPRGVRRVTAAPVAAARVRGSAPLYVAPQTAAAAGPARVSSAAAPVAEQAPAAAPPSAVTSPPAAAPPVESAPSAPAAEIAASAAQGTALYDLVAVESELAAESAPAEQPAARPAEPGTWQPVPVPVPTYTLKAKAPRVTPRPAPAAAAIEDLPFDGHALALDEEFEELPAVRMG